MTLGDQSHTTQLAPDHANAAEAAAPLGERFQNGAERPAEDTEPPAEDAKRATDDAERYPIGRFAGVASANGITPEQLGAAVATLAELPEQLRNAVEDLDDVQLGTPYRAGGWTVRQLVHHVADSHTQALSRVKLALTEEWPTIATYDEAAWARLADSGAPVEWSLELLEALHARWGLLLRSLDDAAWQRGFVHPERGRMTIAQATLIYAWHSRHHLAHITHLRAVRGW